MSRKQTWRKIHHRMLQTSNSKDSSCAAFGEAKTGKKLIGSTQAKKQDIKVWAREKYQKRGKNIHQDPTLEWTSLVSRESWILASRINSGLARELQRTVPRHGNPGSTPLEVLLSLLRFQVSSFLSSPSLCFQYLFEYYFLFNTRAAPRPRPLSASASLFISLATGNHPPDNPPSSLPRLEDDDAYLTESPTV